MRLIKDEKSIECIEVTPKKTNALSDERIGILRFLSAAPSYPAEIARKIGIPIQSVYYHIQLLEKAGLIEFSGYSERNGGVAKKYTSKADAIGLILNEKGWRKASEPKKKEPKLLGPFIKNGFFDGLIVVGSPDPHGKYRARGSELGMLELAMYLGNYASFDFPLYSLDTQLKTDDRKRNLVLAGGPKVNTLIAEINNSMPKSLPIRFDTNNFEVESTLSKKRYSENIGVIELIKNPFSSGPTSSASSSTSSILVVAGLNQHGTRAAVIALVKKMDEIEEGNKFNKKIMAKVIEGFDEDGDGVVDAVEIRE
ncbi:helix-turn-helix domain-containing protein [Candidatus Micrarchaeota archaeon]|nr:helix-turn-helix domain-containing protein [Candidatus Micrarchaeota archaeon]